MVNIHIDGVLQLRSQYTYLLYDIQTGILINKLYVIKIYYTEDNRCIEIRIFDVLTLLYTHLLLFPGTPVSDLKPIKRYVIGNTYILVEGRF
jgi:hypothetical protein